MAADDAFNAARNTVEGAVEDMADFIYNLFTDEVAAERFDEDPVAELELAGQGDADAERLNQALEMAVDRLPSQVAQAVRSQMPADSGPDILRQTIVRQVPVRVPGPTRTIVRNVSDGPSETREVIRRVQQNVTEVRNVTQNFDQRTLNETTVNETTVDNRILNEITAEGDVDLDIDQDNVTATDGSVAAGDDIEDSAINTGTFEGVQNAGEGLVDAEGAVIGDDNVTVADSELGALALGGDATNVEAEGNANLGSGTINDLDAGENLNFGEGELTDVEAGETDQVVVGEENEVAGDTDVEIEGVEGNAGVAVGDENAQLADQDNDQVVDQSVTDASTEETVVDNSVADSANASIDDSFNTDQEATTTVEDNDTTLDNDTAVDASEETTTVSELDAELELDHVEDSEVDLEAELGLEGDSDPLGLEEDTSALGFDEEGELSELDGDPTELDFDDQ